MARLTKIFICPYFGDFPEWIDKFELPEGYEFLVDTNLEGFKQRVKLRLGIDYPGVYGNGKVWDYRCALGYLYEEEVKHYKFWGTVDFDVVFGDTNKWFPDEQLNELDIWSNHDTYVCGFFSLYRNSEEVRELFFKYPHWKEKMTDKRCLGWVEEEYSRLVEQSGLRYKYSFFQGNPYNPPFNLKKEDGKLYQDGVEIAMLHFRRDKKWPL